MTDLPDGIAIRRSVRARNARLVVRETGEAVVVLPREAPDRVADKLVERHGSWLRRHRRRIRAERAELAARPPLLAGRSLTVDGQPLRITLGEQAGARRGRIEPRPGELVVHVGHDGRIAADLLDAYLRGRARTVIGAAIAPRAPSLDVSPGRLSIRDQRSRWASASASGDLSFSWRLVLAPPWVLDAIVVHELAHLRIRGHGRRFWRLVERHAPRTAEARAWLRGYGRQLRAALEDVTA